LHGLAGEAKMSGLPYFDCRYITGFAGFEMPQRGLIAGLVRTFPGPDLFKWPQPDMHAA